MDFGNFILKSVIKVVGIKERNNTEDIPLVREKIDYWSRFLRQPKNVYDEVVEFEKFKAEWLIPNEYDTDKVLLYFHGGGYAISSPRIHRRLIAKICRKAELKGFAVYYRLAPENKFPAPIEDALEAYRYLLDQGFLPKNIVVGGDSAGAGLAVGFCVALKDNNLLQPAAIACLSPWVDLEGTGISNREEWRVDGILTNSRLQLWGRLYTEEEDLRHPYASPIYADLSGLPPILIQVSSDELLHSDATGLKDRAEKWNVEVTFHEYPKMVHVWHVWNMLIKQADEAISEIGEFYRKQLF